MPAATDESDGLGALASKREERLSSARKAPSPLFTRKGSAPAAASAEAAPAESGSVEGSGEKTDLVQAGASAKAELVEVGASVEAAPVPDDRVEESTEATEPVEAEVSPE